MLPPATALPPSVHPLHTGQKSESGIPQRGLLCGLSTRAVSLFLEPILKSGSFDLSPYLNVVGVVEPDKERVAAFNRKYNTALRCFGPEDWHRALKATSPDVTLVTAPDYLHEEYILRSLACGLDVVTEKPMVISSEESCRVLAAEAASRGSVRVAFNYRHHPMNRRIKEFLDTGRLGRIVQVDLRYSLDTLHGASYFYRWNRQRKYSGSLAVHKCCHSFDLIRWWIGQDPEWVMALGSLDYYGPTSSHRPNSISPEGECPYFGKWFKTANRPIDLDHPVYALQGDEGLPFPYQYPSRLSLYDSDIDIEDNYSALIRYDGGAKVTCSVNFSSPWEGFDLVISGERGRLEAKHYVSESRCPFPAESHAVFLPLFGEIERLHWDVVSGGHGGADARMLRTLFTGGTEGDALATSWDGAMAVAVGEAVWRSAVERRQVFIKDLLPRGGIRAFSLMQLLVVLAIIAVLTAMLIPATQRSIDAAKKAQCAGNLKRMGAAIHLYIAENNGLIPGPSATAIDPYFSSESLEIGRFLAPYMGITDLPLSSVPVSQRKMQTDFVSPTMRSEVERMHQHSQNRYSYFTNSDNWAKPYRYPFGKPRNPRIEPIRATQYFADRSPATTWAIRATDHELFPTYTPGTLSEKPIHRGGRNTLFFDGHVEFLPIGHPLVPGPF